jgi:hypothetical protein
MKNLKLVYGSYCDYNITETDDTNDDINIFLTFLPMKSKLLQLLMQDKQNNKHNKLVYNKIKREILDVRLSSREDLLSHW